MTAPLIAACVASHDRPLRLRWMLNGLEEQTLDKGRFEVVVSHDSTGPETEQLLREHPLAKAGVLRHVTLPPGSAWPAANRNAAWRAARAPLVAFMDDDCRPAPDWLERYLDAAEHHPGAIIQGRTIVDPVEDHLKVGPHRSVPVTNPPELSAQTCNILYPRHLLERLGGFDETLLYVEDTDLCARGRKLGADYVGAPEALNFHAVEPTLFHHGVRDAKRWLDFPRVVKRHPDVRSAFPMGLFWHRGHVWLLPALAGAVLQRRNPLYVLLAFPYLMQRFPAHGLQSPRGRLRALTEFPRIVLTDVAQMAVQIWGSVKARTIFL